MNNVEKIKIPTSGIFTNYIFKTIPLAFDESMSYYETLCAILYYIKNTIIPAIDNNADAIIELENLYNQLKEYVDNYFENLDIQTEINNKLDDMAESGELDNIIAQYIQLQGVLAYNTVSEMKNSNNFINGSICKTLGNISYEDGLGRFYKIRTITSSDVVDEVNIISLINSNTLIAELIPEKYINDIGNLNNLNTTNKSNLVNALNEINSSIPNELTELVIFGDSWCDETNENTLFPNILSSELKLNKHNYGVAGAGFVLPSTNLMSTQITTFTNDTSYDKNKIKYVVILAGINDLNNNVSVSDLRTSITSFINQIKQLAPNSTILYANNFKYPYNLNNEQYWLRLHQLIRSDTNIKTFNMSGIFGEPLFTNDYFHLNQAGQKIMSTNLISCLTGGDIIGYDDVRVYTGTKGTAVLSTMRNKYEIIITFWFTPDSTDLSGTIPLENTNVDVSYRSDVSRLAGVGVGNNSFEIAIQSNQLAYSFVSAPNISSKYTANIIIPIY